MDILKQTLSDLGLTDKEIDIYLILQTTGVSPASMLGQRAGITRSTAQYVCQQLAKRGIVSTSHKGNTYLYAAEPPEKLLLLLEKERQSLDQREIMVNRIIGTLRGMQHPDSARPMVRFFEGREGLIAVYDEILKDVRPGDIIRSYVSPLDPASDGLKLMPILNAFAKRRRTLKVPRRIISTDTDAAQSIKLDDPKALHETRILPGADHGGYVTEIMLYGDCMYSINYTLHAVFAFIVQSESFVRMQRDAYDALWDKIGSASHR